MTAPRLNRRLILEEALRAPDGAGGSTLTWVVRGVIWAAIQQGAARERVAEFATMSSVACRITVRGAPFGAPSRPKPDQRFRDGQRTYRITGVSEADAEGRYLVCAAVEEVVA